MAHTQAALVSAAGTASLATGAYDTCVTGEASLSAEVVATKVSSVTTPFCSCDLMRSPVPESAPCYKTRATRPARDASYLYYYLLPQGHATARLTSVNIAATDDDAEGALIAAGTGPTTELEALIRVRSGAAHPESD